MKLKETNRGFLRGEFTDIYGAECSIQESSLVEPDALWLGMDNGTHHLGECLARMHLDRKLAAELIPLLQRFVQQGNLRPRNPRSAKRRK